MKLLSVLWIVLAASGFAKADQEVSLASANWDVVFEGRIEHLVEDKRSYDDVLVLLRKVSKSTPSGAVDFTLGAILVGRGELRGATLFRVETLQDGTQAWVPFYQSEASLLAVPPDAEPAYSGTLSWSGSNPLAEGSRLTIELNAVDSTRYPTCRGKIFAERSVKYRWSGEVGAGEKVFFKSDDAREVTLRRTSANIQGKVGRQTLGGEFAVNDWAKSVLQFQRVKITSSTPTGRKTDREISAVGLLLDEKAWFGSVKRKLFLINQEAKVVGCEFNAVVLSE